MKNIMSNSQIQNERLNDLSKKNKTVSESARRGNEQSGEYRNQIISITDKIIFLSFGSASLLLTFIGVMFSSDRETEALEFKYALIALCGFVLTPLLLLISRWANSSYLYFTVLKYYQNDLLEKYQLEQTIYEKQEGPIVNSETYEVVSEDAGKQYINDIKDHTADVKNEAKVSEKKEAFFNLFAKIFLWSGYITLFVSYCATIKFFLGVIAIMNS
jgi:hypothetical protein